MTNIHRNTAQELVEITVDKLRLILTDHRDNLEQKKKWQTPLGIVITLVVVFPTTDFKQAFGVKPEVWQALFMGAAILSGVWLVSAAIDAWRSPSVADVIDKIKRGA